MQRLAVAAAVLAGSAMPALADREPPPTLEVTGHATETRRPDRVLVDVGVVTRRQTSTAAAGEHARAAREVLEALRSAVGGAGTVRTLGYTLQPELHYPEQGEAKVTGYAAQSIVRVTLDDLSRIGPVIDRATAAGANRVERLQFTLRDSHAARAAALAAAARDARGLATRLAAASGVRLVRVHRVAEHAPPTPVSELRMARAERAVTPIEPGTIELAATVTLAYEIAPVSEAAAPRDRRTAPR